MRRPPLDIAPLRRGHTLVVPKTHISRVSELPGEFAAACGMVVTKVARAITGGASHQSTFCPLYQRGHANF